MVSSFLWAVGGTQFIFWMTTLGASLVFFFRGTELRFQKALLGFAGVFMTCSTKFFQLSHFGHWMKNTIGAIFGDKHVTNHTEDHSISQFQSLCTALAATVGTGNIVGVSGAIATGGPESRWP